MKKIYSLYVANLNNNQHFSYMELAVAACALYEVIGVDFRKLVEAFRAAFEHEDDMFLHHDRSALTERLQKADAERIRLFRHMRDFIKTYETCNDETKLSTAAILMKIIGSYGGGNITSLKADERSAALTNLVQDFEREYPEQIAQLGCTEMVTALKEANQTYLDIATERAQFDSEFGMALVATARKQTDVAYRALVDAVNAAATVDTQGELSPYIDYMNVNVRKYRTYIGQSLADMDGTASGSMGGSDSATAFKMVTFHFVGGRTEKFPVEVGTPLVAPSNTEGYRWKPEVPELMPATNKIFREEPIDDREVRLTFHYLDHTEEDLEGVVGSALTAPANTEGCHWEPEVPSVFPEEDMTFNEVLDEPSSEESEGSEGRTYTLSFTHNGEVLHTYQYAEGERVGTIPIAPMGYEWVGIPTTMPGHDVTVTTNWVGIGGDVDDV